MKIYRYWAKADEKVRRDQKEWNVQCYGGSDHSIEEALQRAQQRARHVAAALNRGEPQQQYPYAEQAIREEIVQEFQHDDQSTILLTRNAYGSLILNTPCVLFADIDYQPRGVWATITDGVAKLLGKPRQTQDQQTVTRLQQITAANRGLAIRLYRTSNGFRCLVTSHCYDPASPRAIDLLTQLGSDPLYISLCKSQQCFRARLSPKHWRCDAPRPPSRYPWSTADAERRYRQWEAEYQQKADRFATCALIGEFGSAPLHAAVQPVLKLHDSLTCHDDLPLA